MIAMIMKFYKLEHRDPLMHEQVHAYDIYQMKIPSFYFNYTKRTNTVKTQWRY